MLLFFLIEKRNEKYLVYVLCYSEHCLLFAGAIPNIMTHHNYTHNMIDTVTVAIKAGTNLELGSRAFDHIVSHQSSH